MNLFTPNTIIFLVSIIIRFCCKFCVIVGHLVSYVFVWRRKITFRQCYCYRYRRVIVSVAVLLLLLVWTSVWVSWKLIESVNNAFVPSPSYYPLNDLSHFKRNRSLQYYFDNIDLLIEPSSPLCTGLEEVPVLVMVASAPGNWEQREAIRDTWGKHLPSFFILGLERNDYNFTDTYVEANRYEDMVIYDFKDHYQNLTLKTALMMKWTLERCPQAQFLYKTNDDVLINPWKLGEVLDNRSDAIILGYMHNNSILIRDPNHKRYLPRWLCPEDVIPAYVAGPGYFINGEYLQDILDAAFQVPLHNIDDLYFTYSVAQKTLGYVLMHDVRLNAYRPHPHWLPLGCAYWPYFALKGITAQEMLRIWSYMRELFLEFLQNEDTCYFYNRFINKYVIYGE